MTTILCQIDDENISFRIFFSLQRPHRLVLGGNGDNVDQLDVDILVPVAPPGGSSQSSPRTR